MIHISENKRTKEYHIIGTDNRTLCNHKMGVLFDKLYTSNEDILPQIQLCKTCKKNKAIIDAINDDEEYSQDILWQCKTDTSNKKFALTNKKFA